MANDNGTKKILLTIVMLITICGAVVSGAICISNNTSSIKFLKEDHDKLRIEYSEFCKVMSDVRERLLLKVTLIEKQQEFSTALLNEINNDIKALHRNLQVTNSSANNGKKW